MDFDIPDRIKQVRTSPSIKMSQTDFGEKIGATRDAINNLENRRAAPNELILKAICREFNVDYFWLTEGTGEMFVDKDIDTQFMDLIDKAMSGENEFIRGVFKAFAKFGDAEWEMLEKFVKDIYENGVPGQKER